MAPSNPKHVWCHGCGARISVSKVAKVLGAKGGAAKFRNMSKEDRAAYARKMVAARELKKVSTTEK